MTFGGIQTIKRIGRAVLAGILAVATLLPATTVQASNERALYLHYTHTKETARIVFKRNGQYVREGLNQLNVFLRDWRRNEPANMDPALFDLLWEVYQETGSNQPIHIVSAYRSPATNAMLASQSSGVAGNSQHMAGKAIDFYIPGFPVNTLREIGFRKQVGGVGYYPSSGTAFVHLDTGSVRAWPRMTTAQLQQLFPDGRTLHLPSNGKVLSQEGYNLAQADYQRCGRVPCSGGNNWGSSDTRTASANSGPNRTLWDWLTGTDGNQTQQAPVQQAAVQAAPAQAPASRAVTSVSVQQAVIAPPTPPTRPTAVAAAQPQNIPFAVVDADTIRTEVAAIASAPAAPVPPAMSRTIAELRAGTPSATAQASNEGALAIAAIDQQPPARPDFGASVAATAYAAPNARIQASPAPQAAAVPLARPASAATPQPAAVLEPESMAAASLAPEVGLDSFAALFEGPILPLDGRPDAATENALTALKARDGELFAPDLDHVTELFTHPSSMSSAQFAFFSDPDNADFSPETELGTGTHGYAFARTASLGTGASGGDGGTIWVTLR
ncbi:DUF882 domain-containing protein [Pelagibacterium limicola]|uniref:DUF882 domain-containing protein n=1 Tax=Pelagibacterium limicola TaxID=2791022 RepID=UPI0031B62E1D